MALSILPSSQSSVLCINRPTTSNSDIILVEPPDNLCRVAFLFGVLFYVWLDFGAIGAIKGVK